ncbi:MAG: hypothetical protein K0Q49_2345, partial [Haloplasmataceae bacterium]|nr:hypothetical protein [Haloplasmataceae bacterium]
MEFSYDINGYLKQSKMFLSNPQKDRIGTIADACEIKLVQNFNNLTELEFTIYKKLNGEYNDLYDEIIKMRLIEVQYVGWFHILSAKEKYDESSAEGYKAVKCCFLENALIYRKISDINGVFALYDVGSPDKSLLHIIASETGWSIAHVSNSLLSKYRTFSEDTVQIYNFLTTTVSKSYECVFQFNVYDKSISAYKLDEIGSLTDIVLSKKNILKEWEKDDGTEVLTSKMKVLGGTDSTTGNPIDIREVNPTGTNYLVNFSYFMDNGLASQSLINAWNAYTAKYNSTVTNYITALNTYKTKVAELTTLNSQLTDLQSNQTAQSTIMGTLVQSNNNKVPNSSDTGYTLYQEALGLYNSYTSQIYLKKVEIITKESEITTAKNALSAISSTIDWSSNFTQVQLSELNNFIFQNEDYEDSTFVIGESTSSEEAIEIKLELMQNAANELAKISHPQYTFTTTMSNLFSIRDDKDSIISYSEWRNKFQIGNLITIKFTDTYYLTVRLIQISINFNNIEEIECTFSNKSRLDDELTQLAETIANSGKAANSYSLSKFGYDSASSINSEVRDFMNSMLTATKNAMASNDNQELLIDTYGLHMKKWLPDQNIYSPYQAWWTNNTLLFTDDSWNSSKGGIGVFTDSSGNKTMSVFADVICGQLLMSEKLYISNNSGTYTINNHGFIATATVGSNTYSAGINPSVPSEIINVKVNGVNKLYVDTVNNRLAIDGALVAGSININNRFTVDSTGACTATALTLTGGAINIGNRFIVTTAGIVTINSNSLIVNSSNFTLTEDGTLTCNN